MLRFTARPEQNTPPITVLHGQVVDELGLYREVSA